MLNQLEWFSYGKPLLIELCEYYVSIRGLSSNSLLLGMEKLALRMDWSRQLYKVVKMSTKKMKYHNINLNEAQEEKKTSAVYTST